MNAATEVEEILQRPHFTLVYHKIQAALEAEKARREEFYAEMNEDTNAEFINGEVVMHSPVRVRHLFTVSQLVSVLNVHNVRNDLGFVGAGKGLICLTRNDFEPDICFFSKEKAAAFKPDQMKLPAPDFIAEVLSPSTERQDRGIKFIDYAAPGVREYWIADPEAESVEQYLLSDDEYQLAGKFTDAQIIGSEVISGLRFPVDVLFDQQAARAFYRRDAAM